MVGFNLINIIINGAYNAYSVDGHDLHTGGYRQNLVIRHLNVRGD